MKRKVLAGVLAIVLACGMVSGCGKNSDVDKANSVSYTHLDVYKRQVLFRSWII